MDTKAQDDGRDAAKAVGRARVRDLLIVPLSGLKRSPKVRAEDYDRLADQLAYMREETLRGLCEFVLRVAGGSPVPGPMRFSSRRRGTATMCPA